MELDKAAIEEEERVKLINRMDIFPLRRRSVFRNMSHHSFLTQFTSHHNQNLAKGNDDQMPDTFLSDNLTYCNLKPQSFRGISKYRRWKILALVIKAIVRMNLILRDLYNLQEEMKLYCCLFPSDYEFDKETIVQLWTAMGFLRKGCMEAVGGQYFNILLEEKYIRTSRIDIVTRKCKYKVDIDKVKEFLNGTPTIKNKYQCYTILKDEVSAIEKSESLHVSIVSNCINQCTLETLLLSYRHDLRSLLFIRNYGSSLKQISPAIFLALNSLEALDLSGTHLIELPSSIGNLKQLRYFDVSFTLLECLPKSIGGLQELQTLKLRGCNLLRELPKDLIKLVNLRHLEFDVFGKLSVMPRGIGALTELRTLPSFTVDADEVSSIQELENMNYLSGSCCISGLNNVSYINASYGTFLREKRHLTDLQLRWSYIKSYDTRERDEAFKIISYCLQPSPCLEKLQLCYYPGIKLPYWIGKEEYVKLVSITLLKCEHAELCVRLGMLPNLKYLNIIQMDSVTVIDDSVRGYDGHTFPKLEILIVDSMLNLETWIEVTRFDFPLLSKFVIKECPKLHSLPFLPWLRSLKHLQISGCVKFKSLPSTKLSTSVETLVIDDCPLLKRRCLKGGSDWDKIKHVQRIWIDFKDIKSHNADKNSRIGKVLRACGMRLRKLQLRI